ncbi:hypothetical protein GGI12_004144 [Dipsacomyces acuminosporus]|nr:hypothetical protein GGI12_004144 [Dipsacomyces acuminosporus]
MPHHTALPQSHHHGYAEANQSPVPTLTNSTSRSSSASSSVNSLSPEALATTPRDLMPQFKTVVGANDGDGAAGTKAAMHKIEESVEDKDDLQRGQQRKRRREGEDDSNPVDKKTREKRTKRSQPRRLTGSVDFVAKFGLYDLYEQYVRPYTGVGSRQPLPDLASAYLDGVKGAVKIQAQTPGSLRDLVLMPPKNEFEHLDLLPMASIKPAFSIGSSFAGSLQQQQQRRQYAQSPSTHSSFDERTANGDTKRPRIRVRLSTDGSTVSSPGSGYQREAAGIDADRGQQVTKKNRK